MYKIQLLEVSGAVRDIYVYDISRLRVKLRDKQCTYMCSVFFCYFHVTLLVWRRNCVLSVVHIRRYFDVDSIA
jgi:hypothetical protein